MNTRLLRAAFALVMTVALCGVADVAYGVDGVVLIDQNRAMAGNVTPGDAAGFPVSITQPGSYRLSGNLTVPNENTTAIEISASDVTIDLNGFSVRGPTVCTGTPVTSCAPAGTGRGISTPASFLEFNNITVHNGTVRGMQVGILLNGSGHLVEKVRAESNHLVGMTLEGGTVSHNTVTRNGAGITLEGGTASHNTVRGNGNSGILVVVGIASHNTAIQNGFGLLLGFLAGYIANVMSGNTSAPVSGGVSLGHNLCNGVLC